MNKKRLISALTAVVTGIGMTFSAFSVNCEESETVYDDNIYTLKQLFNMSDEENAQLMRSNRHDGNGFYFYYERVKNDAKAINDYDPIDVIEYGGISGYLEFYNINSEGQETDKEAVLAEAKNTIDEYLGDDVNYQIITEAENSDYSLNSDMIVYFPDYDISNESGEINDSKIMEFAKCWFCLDKVAINECGFSYANRVDNGYLKHVPLYKYHPALPERGYYTLEELFAMDDDKFMQLVDKRSGYQAFEFYNEIRDIASYRNYEYSWECPYITGSLRRILQPNDTDYIPGETEKIIKDVLGDTARYEIESPDIPIVYEQYGNILHINFPDYNSDLYEYESDEWKSVFTNKKVIEMAKIVYCVRQVFDIDYNDGYPLSPGPGPVEPTEEPTEETTEATTTEDTTSTIKATTETTSTTKVITLTTKTTTSTTVTTTVTLPSITPIVTTTDYAIYEAGSVVKIVNQPDKLVYNIGDELDLTGLRADLYHYYQSGPDAHLIYSNVDPTEYPDDFIIDTSSFDSSKAGTYEISVINKYGIFWGSDSFDVTVTDEQGTVTTTQTTEVTTATTTTTVSTTTTLAITETTTTAQTQDINGDSNGDGKLNVRDAAFIAKKLAVGKVAELPKCADFNGDGKINVRDAAAIASYLAKSVKKYIVLR